MHFNEKCTLFFNGENVIILDNKHNGRKDFLMSQNTKAIKFYENNELDKAWEIFKQEIRNNRGVQSLNNFAWMLYREEENTQAAIPLLKEVIASTPSSHFPYNLLGEIYITIADWDSAIPILIKAIELEPTLEAYNNLGVAYYHKDEKSKALQCFFHASKPSEYTMYSYVKCLADLERYEEAESILDTFSDKEGDFVGAVDLADLYAEINANHKANFWFEKGWASYWKEPNWVSRYTYCLIQTGEREKARRVLDNLIKDKQIELQESYEEECDETWTEEDKKEDMEEIQMHIKLYEQMLEQAINGIKEPMEYAPQVEKACYLFGCERHGHPEYND